ncbi:right-handed parallel beta-helix repeat-containing protein [Marinifilum sp.]|uniref:right-handed parallel beta-helix repeat-containing protein n=1 Tax=Marinifilum sp. TaxID=2033137 RepID=UPI003BA8B365
MEKFNKTLLILAMIVSSNLITYGQFSAERYKEWSNTTGYAKTYVVDCNHPRASDQNLGSFDFPFATINKAAQRVKAGERVLIRAGVYREMIEPWYGGTGADKMISYEAMGGERVIVKGSRIFNTKWLQNMVFTDALPESEIPNTWSRKVWVSKLPENLFEKGYNPFTLPNILPNEHDWMPWSVLTIGKPPYNLKRGLLFQDGKRMTQLTNERDLTRIPGSYWVGKDSKSVHIHPFGSKDPNSSLFEIAVQSHLFKPQKVGLAYIQIKGITFEHCANGFLRTSTGAVTAFGGDHWIIEGNTIRHINSSGLEFGYFAFEIEDTNPLNVQPRKGDEKGGMIVRNNRIYDCGTAGIRSFTVVDGIIENNTICNCGWQDAENYWEVAGIKMLRNKNTLVRGNHIHHIQGGNGIWMDWDNQYSRVTKNIIHDIQTIQGGIFVEASKYPNLIDNNFLWNIDGHGIYGNDSDDLYVVHNLVANTTAPVVNAIVSTDRYLNGKKLTAENNTVKNNIFIDAAEPVVLQSATSTSDYNLFVSSKQPKMIHLSQLQKNGKETNSFELNAFASFNPDIYHFKLITESEIMKFPKLRVLDTDYYGRDLDHQMVYPGPFQLLSKNVEILLNEVPKN